MIKRALFYFYYILFYGIRKIFPPVPVKLREKSFRKILIFSAAGIGDTLTDSVAIRALKESFPQAHLSVLTHRRRAILAYHNPFIDEVILYHKSLLRFMRLVFVVRKIKPDLVVMLRGNDPDLWPLAYLANRHAVLSCPVMTRFKFLISHPIQLAAWDHTHGVEQTLEMVRYVGADIQDRRLVYRVKEEEQQRVRKQLKDCKALEKPLVVFQLGGGRRSTWRDWPEPHYIELAERLLAFYEVQLILLGGPDLLFKGAVVQSALSNEVLNLVGKLSLQEAAALLSISNILVSTDTGIMHLGFAVGVDTLALIHCNNPASRVGPYGYGEKNLVAELRPPAGIKPSKEVDMALLTPDMVWTKLKLLCERNNFSERAKLKVEG